MILKNIQNQIVDGFEISPDGVVYGYSLRYDKLSLNEESCRAIGMVFNTVCRWGNPSGISPNIDIPLISSEKIDLVKEDDCEFILEVEHLVFIDNNATPSEFAQRIDDIECSITLSRGNTRFNFYLTDQDFTYRITNDIDTGVYVNNNSNIFGNSVSNIKGVPYQAKNFRSNWIKTSFPININQTQTDLVLGVIFNNAFKGVSLKLDNIKIYKICSGYKTIIKEISINPSFEFERVVDNKKSWTEEDEFRKPRFIRDRYANYHTKEDRLVLNSKELEVDLNFKKAFNELLFNYCKKHKFFRIIGISDQSDIYKSFDIFVEFMESEINSPRYNKVSGIHPLINVLRNRFLTETSFGMEDISNMVNKLDKYWLDIISQFIPSTSIWESNIVISNNVLSNQKYQYKKYTLEPSGLGSISNTINVDVVVDIAGGSPQINNVPMTIKNYSEGSEFYGTITIS